MFGTNFGVRYRVSALNTVPGACRPVGAGVRGGLGCYALWGSDLPATTFRPVGHTASARSYMTARSEQPTQLQLKAGKSHKEVAPQICTAP